MTVTIRAYRASDRARVLELYEEAFGAEKRDRFARRWHWQFERNPAHESVASRIWIAELDGQVVGHLATFPARFQCDGEIVIVHHDCDLLVAASARRRGIGQRLVEAYDAMDNPLSNALANYTSANQRIRQRLGYRPCHLMHSRVAAFSATAYMQLHLRSRRSWRRFENGAWWWLARGIGTPLYLRHALLDRLARPTRTRATRIERIDGATSAFDELWERARGDYRNIAVRDRAFAAWRYFDDPSFEHTVLGYRDARGLVAYLVYCRATEYGLRIARIIDAFCPLADRRHLAPLIDGALRELRGSVDYVRCIGLHPQLRDVIAPRLPVRPRRLDRPSWLLAANDVRDAPPSTADRWRLDEPERWYLSYADSDLAFS